MSRAAGWPSLFPSGPHGVFEQLAIWIIQPAVSRLPQEVTEAASMDCAGPYRTFWSDAAAPAAVGRHRGGVCTIFAWNEFFSLILTNKARIYPVLASSVGADSGPEWGTIAATSLLTVVPILVLCVLLPRHWSADPPRAPCADGRGTLAERRRDVLVTAGEDRADVSGKPVSAAGAKHEER